MFGRGWKVSRLRITFSRAMWILVVSAVIYLPSGRSATAREWERVNCERLSNFDNKSSFPMKPFNDGLFVGTWNPAGTELWMSSTKTNGTWYQVNESGFGNPENIYPTAMAVFKDSLYVAVFNGESGEIWHSGDGLSWRQAAVNPLAAGKESIRVISPFAPAGDIQCLFMGTACREGTGIWMSCDGIDWTAVGEQGLGDTFNTAVCSMETFNNHLYLGTLNQQTGTQVFRTRGGLSWSQVNSDGFGSASNRASYSMCSFKGHLYVGSVNQLTGTQVWRTGDGTTWYQSNIDGFGDAENTCSYCMTVFRDSLYVGPGNTVARVWRTRDGVQWEKVSEDGFGNEANRRVHSLAGYGDYLYAGTGNESGTELWRWQVHETDPAPCFLETVLGENARELDALRVLRRVVRERVPGGEWYVEQYYHYSPEMITLYNTCPGMKGATMHVLHRAIAECLRVLTGEQEAFNPATVENVSFLLGRYAKAGSPGLRLALQNLMENIWREENSPTAEPAAENERNRD